MNILINTSNLAKGGGLQVASSVCRYLNKYDNHYFVVVLCYPLKHLAELLTAYDNVKRIVCYSFPAGDKRSLLTGRNAILDSLVDVHSINCVLSIFGPITWRPRCTHVCGFAIPHLVLPESPYLKTLSFKSSLRNKLWTQFNILKFRHGTKYLFTENPLISERVEKLIKGSEVRTITNTYNQVFDKPELQKRRELPPFKGLTILTVSSSYPHKNLQITTSMLEEWRKRYPTIAIRFVLTINENEMPKLSIEQKSGILTIGKVDISEVPSLYEQCDIVLQPSLLECFSAVYVEAMRTRKPLLVPDLAFVHGICGNAALYYNPVSSEDAVNKLHVLIDNHDERKRIVELGISQLASFDTSESRADKLIKYCEDVTTLK